MLAFFLSSKYAFYVEFSEHSRDLKLLITKHAYHSADNAPSPYTWLLLFRPVFIKFDFLEFTYK